MCEQTPVDYKDGDIVWVKLGPCWWPGEVRELSKLPPEWFADFKKQPITAVKFFDEDSYEYVRSIDKIYSYNCTKKNEFIKKGLDLYRAKNTFMGKFPADVSTAEARTDGDPNIIDSPLFSQEKKTNFAAILFGSSKSKKTPKKSGGGGNKRLSSGSANASSPSSSSKASKMITHPRFLGRDDHEVRILLQSPDKAEVEEHEVESTYDCTSCGFKTSRIDVIVLHNKSHIQGVYSTPTSTIKKGKKSPLKRGKKVLKMTRSKTSSIVEDLDLIEKGLLLSTESSDEELAEEDWDSEPKRKRKKNKRKSKKVQSKREQESKVDIRDNLLAEWEDDSEEVEVEEDINLNTSSTAESDTSINKVDELNKTLNKIDISKKDADKSCFDFEEEEDNEIIGTSVGRKIPRVIPHTDRQKNVDPGIGEANLPTAEDDINRNEQIKEVHDVVKDVVLDIIDKEVEMEADEDKNQGPNVDAFKDILDSTAVPDLPEIPHSLKFEQNFHNAKTIKFPDKPATELAFEDKPVIPKPEVKEVAEAATKLINPKKRFVKSFEDFEQQWNNEQKKLAESEEQLDTEQSTLTKMEESQNSEQDTSTKLEEPQGSEQDKSTKNEELQNSEQDKSTENEELLFSKQDKLIESQEQLNSEQNILVDLEQQLNNEQEELVEPESQLKNDENKIAEPEQQTEKIRSVVEVSKLKTQLMSKLENAEKLLTMEQTRNKLLEMPRHSRSHRERILEKRKEETADDSWFIKKPAVDKSSPKNKYSSFTQPTSPPHESKNDINVIQRMEDQTEELDIISPKELDLISPKELDIIESKELDINAPKESVEWSDNIVVTDNNVITDSKSKSHTKLSFTKPRRLSVKIPEVGETYEIEHTAELLELEQVNVMKVEQAEVLEEQKSTEIPQVEQIITETPRTESQITNESNVNIVSDHSEFFEEKIILNDTELNKEQPNSQFEDSSIYTANVSNENSQQQSSSEESLESLTETVVTDLHKENELPKIEERLVDNSLEIKHADIIQLSETPPEAEGNKEMDEFICMQLSSVSAEHEAPKSIDSEMNSNIQTCVNFASTKMEYNSSNFRIDTKDSEDLSALSTLAAVSELTTNLDIQGNSHDEKSKIIEGNLASVSDIATSLEIHSTSSEKSKVMEGNLTFVTEDDLADGQVEIADISNIDKHKSKPITLSSFSVDFTDPSQTANTHISLSNDMHEVSAEVPLITNTISRTNKRKYSRDIDQSEVIEKSLEKVFKEETHCSTTLNVQNSKSMKLTNLSAKSDLMNSPNIHDASNCDIEDQIPSLVVRSSKQPDIKNMLLKTNYLEKPVDYPEYTSSSKLLEILTDGKPKSTKPEFVTSQKSHVIFDIPPQSARKVDSKLSSVISKEVMPTAKNVSKFDPKNSKFVIKSTITAKTNVVPIPGKSNRPIILSEKIIKPVSETESVSVQKVTSKRSSSQDIEDIDTFIIKKPAKKMMVSQEIDVNESPPVVSHTVKKPTALRGKAKILQQTIIKPAGEVIQPTTSFPATTTFSATTAISQTPIDDNMFDINSMPIVLGDQILTAESIENMPVVLSDSVQSPCTKSIAAVTTTVGKSQTEQIKLLNKSTPSVTTQSMLVKTYSSQKLAKNPRVFQTGTTKVVKSNPPIITRTGKSDKFIIVPSGSSTPTTSKYTPSKRPPVMKRPSPVILPTPTSAAKVQTPSSEPTGNKIMIVTNQQGRQSRVLLTPAQQKLLGYQSSGSKLVKNTLKGNILQKASTKSSGISPLANMASPKVPSMISHAIMNSKGEIISTSNQNLITSDGQVLMPIKSQQIRGLKTETSKGGRKIQMQSQKVLLQEGLNALKGSSIPGQQKTIVIKNQQGQIVKKFHGTDDAILEQQVAEQVQAIKASGSFSSMKARQEVSTSKIKPVIRRSYPKKSSTLETTRNTSKTQMLLSTSVGFTPSKLQKTEASVPPLAPISPKRSDTLLISQSVPKIDEIKLDASSALNDIAKPEQVQQKPLNQLIIQDALGNQTTITEGQILALPSGETIDGQPQSYMLVTLDESGNLAPLNNEALLSLDPNLCLGGDLSNMVLQIDEGTVTAKPDTTDSTKTAQANANFSSIKEVPVSQNSEIVQKETQQANIVMPVPAQEQLIENKSLIPENVNVTNHSSSGLLTSASAESIETSQPNLETVQTVTCSIGSDPNQQLIITGDPISTQKFIESLTEANPDLANLLASAEGNILIQTDEQQILINTDAENQVLLPMNAENLSVIENSEGDGNPIFATQPTKNQDILAAALADTDVFQQEQTALPVQAKVSQSQLSPNSGLFPSGVSNVLETTLSLSSPIMTPLEVPSSNNKKIPDEETDILTTEVPKNVDLPITITDPNISQTVAQQQVAALMASELTSNLDLPLTITDQGVPLTSAEMNSPSYVYSLPTLDESVDMHPKTFSGPISMPLLNEEPQETSATETNITEIDTKNEIAEKVTEENKTMSTLSEIDIQTSSSDSNLHTSSVNEVSTLFETPTLVSNDCMKNNDKLQSTSRTFMGTTIETEEGLCTLGGAMCSSLSEPPPDMFDLSVVNSSYRSETGIKDHIETNIPESAIVSNASENSPESCQSKPDCNLDINLPTNEQNASIDEYDKYESYDTESRNDGTPLSNLPLNSESSSPAVNIDENSCEIPVQPQIVTDLSSSSFDTHETTDSADFESNKRISADDSIENEKKKMKFD